MKKFDQTVLDVIGNTPIVRLKNVAKHVSSEIYVKLEYLNPGGSIKDRIGKYMLDRAVENGDLKPGGTIIEGTSGNTGVGLAMWANIHGYKCIFVLADKQSQEKIQNLRAFGAKVIVCPTNVEPEDPRSYYSVSARLSKTIPNSFYVNQYDNLTNRETHYHTTGPEIVEQTGGDFDVFMAGVGTGGTISGTAAYLKEKMPHVQVVGVDCEGSIVAEYAQTGKMGQAHPYVIEGIGEDFIPKNYDFKLIDDWVVVNDKESFVMTRRLLDEEAIYAGGSSGSAVSAAIRYAEKLKTPKKILVILPDSGNRYASKIFNDDWMREGGYDDYTLNVEVSEVIRSLKRPKDKIISIEDTAKVGDAIELMKQEGVSQLPVMENGLIKGIVQEKDLMRPVFEGKLRLEDTISLAYGDNYQVVNSGDLLAKVADALLSKDVVFVKTGDEITHILTNIDILQFVSKKGAHHAI